ncbi:MAG: tetratricopeptide repeat protein, partial [Hyphomicrobium sp.]|nr:tetratricopeptide repeat protein [Hyphomicrobium sp.]
MRRPKGATAPEYRGTSIAARFEGNIAVFARQPILTLGVLLVLALFSVLLPAGAQERWPPWQSYGEAEDSARKKAGRRVKSSEITLLNRQIARLKAAGKHAEALPLAEKALALAEKKGPDSPDVAKALDTLAELYEAENKYAEAEPLLKRALAIREKAPGQPDVAASRERLAATYDKLGRAADAEALRVTVVTVETNGKGAVKPKKAAKPEAERAKAMAEAEEAKRAAEAGRAEESREQAGKKSAQAEEKGDGPALTPLPRFSARRMAPPADPSGSGGSSSAAPPG